MSRWTGMAGAGASVRVWRLGRSLATFPRPCSRRLSSAASAASGASPANTPHAEGKRRFLRPTFLAEYEHKKAPFGFNGLGELVYRRTYSRERADGSNEDWKDTVERVVEGTFNMQREWSTERQLGFDFRKAQARAEKMYEKIFHMKFLPPGRGLWAMGSPLTEDADHRVFAALNNCAFVSTEQMHDPAVPKSKPFSFLMDASMIGIGVGFDVKGAQPLKDAHRGMSQPPLVLGPDAAAAARTIVVEDSREGWVRSVECLLDSYFEGTEDCVFDYSRIRPAGELMKRLGGRTAGPQPLIDLHASLRSVLDAHRGRAVSQTAIVDMMNLIGRCVVSSNERRTAEIAFGPPDSEEYIELKNYSVNPQRADYGWTSNNSVFCELGMDYEEHCKRVAINGEPGFAWLDNMREFGRLVDPPDFKDVRAKGGNPCLEQTLESYEVCCLVETFPDRHDSLDEFLDTLESAYLYAKTVTLGETHWPETNRVMLRNRRIGCSMSGIAQFITRHGIEELRTFCESGYEYLQTVDRNLSEEFVIPRSIKTTSIKPSGTVSLLAGATSGMHYPESRFIIRRVRLPADSNLVQPLLDAGYDVEPDQVNPRLKVASFPVDHGDGIRAAPELSMWEQLSLAAFLQRFWADNQVSCTVTFDPDSEAKELPFALNYFQYQLKGVSMLPRMPLGSYAQMPLEGISEERFLELSARLRPMALANVPVAEAEMSPDKFCDSSSCEVSLGPDAEPGSQPSG